MKKQETLLIVEDDPYELESYLILAKKAGFDVLGVTSSQDAKYFLDKQRIDILITDIFLKDHEPEGIALVREALSQQQQVLPLVMSSHPDKDLFLKAIEEGALFFLKKPLINSDEISIAVRMAKEKRVLESFRTKQDLNLSPLLNQLCEDGLCIEAPIRKWIRVASENADLPVVIYGETGTGKEEIAKLIAKNRRKIEGDIPFLSVNCALLDGDLVHSVLFGHKKGAFSGACSTTQGFIGEAHGGILFLDEIHTLSMACQQKLLRVLNDGTYNRVGETKQLYSKFQVIVASTVDLDDAVEEGRFLLDLRSRLTGCDILLSPLRERKHDLPLLVELYFIKNGIKVDEKELHSIIERCKEFYWQGNIRQIYQCLRALVAISHADGHGPLAENLPILKTMNAPTKKVHLV